MARFREGTGTALFVALGSLGVFAALAWLIAFLLWLALSIYALVEMFGDGRPSPLAVLLIPPFLVGGIATLAGVAMNLLGRNLTPKRRSRD